MANKPRRFITPKSPVAETHWQTQRLQRQDWHITPNSLMAETYTLAQHLHRDRTDNYTESSIYQTESGMAETRNPSAWRGEAGFSGRAYYHTQVAQGRDPVSTALVHTLLAMISEASTRQRRLSHRVGHHGDPQTKDQKRGRERGSKGGANAEGYQQ